MDRSAQAVQRFLTGRIHVEQSGHVQEDGGWEGCLGGQQNFELAD